MGIVPYNYGTKADRVGTAKITGFNQKELAIDRHMEGEAAELLGLIAGLHQKAVELQQELVGTVKEDVAIKAGKFQLARDHERREVEELAVIDEMLPMAQVIVNVLKKLQEEDVVAISIGKSILKESLNKMTKLRESARA